MPHFADGLGSAVRGPPGGGICGGQGVGRGDGSAWGRQNIAQHEKRGSGDGERDKRSQRAGGAHQKEKNKSGCVGDDAAEAGVRGEADEDGF